VKVQVLRDYGISTGFKNENMWSRRDIHIEEDGIHIRTTLWNDQVTIYLKKKRKRKKKNYSYFY
jgi:hypothetical protein